MPEDDAALGLLCAMNELNRLITAANRAHSHGVKAVLVTVVATHGSVYRRAGARMLVLGDGQTVGAISGGCLERNACAHARDVMRAGAPAVVTYDTTSEADIVWGLGLGCNGVVRLLVEPLEGDARRHLSFLARLACDRQMGVAALVFSAEGETGANVGDRYLLDSSGVHGVVSHVRGAARMILDDAVAALHARQSINKSYRTEGGKVEAFIEVVQPPPSLAIFGAGFDVSPVARFARELGWHIAVVDTRANSQESDRLPEADEIVLCRAQEVGERITLDHRTAAVVMSHNYLHDKEVLRTLVASPARYIGCLGPRRRTERLLRELQSEGEVFSDRQLARVHAPVGLDIGAETAEEIALSIVAEIRAALAGRQGASLKNKLAPIHDPAAEADARSMQREVERPRPLEYRKN